jgi:hypothetical protein
VITVHVDRERIERGLFLAHKHSKKEWANYKTGKTEWNRGLNNNESRPYDVEMQGIMGELAFEQLTEIPIDESWEKKVDFYVDLFIKEKTYRVGLDQKNQTRMYSDVYDGEKFFGYYVRAKGVKDEISIYAFSVWVNWEDFKEDTVYENGVIKSVSGEFLLPEIRFSHCIFKENLLKCPRHISRKNQDNYCISTINKDLFTIEELMYLMRKNIKQEAPILTGGII